MSAAPRGHGSPTESASRAAVCSRGCATACGNAALLCGSLLGCCSRVSWTGVVALGAAGDSVTAVLPSCCLHTGHGSAAASHGNLWNSRGYWEGPAPSSPACSVIKCCCGSWVPRAGLYSSDELSECQDASSALRK